MELEHFDLRQVWNDTIEKADDRPLVERDYVYASEIGGAMIDRYLKMKAVPTTNPPNSRSYRKFMAGDIWEWIVMTVLVRAGIKFRTQDKVSLQLDGCPRISGRIDFIILGGTDFSKVEIDENMPPFMQKLSQAIIKNFEGKTFGERIIEIKSVGSFVFEQIEKMDNPKTHHIYQAGVYSKATGIPADVIYVCRDDVRILQYSLDSILDEIIAEVETDLKTLKTYLDTNTEPPKEQLILWDEMTQKFSKNWKVSYSSYLTMLYTNPETGEAYKEPMDYENTITPIVAGLNRTVTRIATNKISKRNEKTHQQWIEKAEKLGIDFSTLNILPKIDTLTDTTDTSESEE